jgi:hypothetical protein
MAFCKVLRKLVFNGLKLSANSFSFRPRWNLVFLLIQTRVHIGSLAPVSALLRSHWLIWHDRIIVHDAHLTSSGVYPLDAFWCCHDVLLLTILCGSVYGLNVRSSASLDFIQSLIYLFHSLRCFQMTVSPWIYSCQHIVFPCTFMINWRSSNSRENFINYPFLPFGFHTFKHPLLRMFIDFIIPLDINIIILGISLF